MTMAPRIHIITLGVEDLQRSIAFYCDGMGLPTTAAEDAKIAFFQTPGVCLALYPRDLLAEDVSPDLPCDVPAFSGVTVAHVAQTKEEVEAVLERAEAAGGTIEKPAQDVFWGGYSGYFSDPDGHLWEVAYSENWEFHTDGSLVID